MGWVGPALVVQWDWEWGGCLLVQAGHCSSSWRQELLLYIHVGVRCSGKGVRG